MNRIGFINKINTYAARFVLEVEGLNSSNLYDINIHAESFLIPVLNEVFGIRLENLNQTQRKNFPAVDLADFKNRVAFQVTATSNLEKVKTTLEQFKTNGLDNHFDVLYIYIITHKKDTYNDSKLGASIPTNFQFQTAEHVLDKDDLLRKISSLSSTPKIETISKIYEHEFSDVQVQMRQKKYVSGYFSTEPEQIFPNLLKISFPSVFFQADLNINSEQILQDLNNFLASIGKRPVKKLKPAKLIGQALKRIGVKTSEWILHENRIFTFRDLNNPREPFRKIVDIGTIEETNCEDYCLENDDKKRVFKYLLKNTLIEFCKQKEIEWFGQKEIFRFANNQLMPNQKQLKWKGKKEATKTVIFEMQNKKKGHIICFRSLAFRSSFLDIGDNWYIVLNPTWSFTNPGGYDQSRFEPDYMAGLKRLENNGAVFNYFRFFSYYFSHKDLFTKVYPYLEIHAAETLSISPRLEEKMWKTVKLIDKKENIEDLQVDNELMDNSLF